MTLSGYSETYASAYISVIKGQLSKSLLQWVGGPSYTRIIPNINVQLQKINPPPCWCIKLEVIHSVNQQRSYFECPAVCLENILRRSGDWLTKGAFFSLNHKVRIPLRLDAPLTFVQRDQTVVTLKKKKNRHTETHLKYGSQFKTWLASGQM